MISSFKDLVVWQKSRILVKEIYLHSQDFPKYELYGLTSQIRRCAVSIPSNIAEGFQRHHKKEYIQFLFIALGSGAELETQLIIASDLKYLSLKELEILTEMLQEIQRMLQGLIKKL